ncbi:MAG: site-2 protease family protein [Planctomycetaceae bacterium]|jgi:membrane-associated protease RseP (regulator of RpoE activity)|nr:site-2 protease family protein [Planctomycetaceae bacterium]
MQYQVYWRLPLLLFMITWLTTTGFRFDNGIIYHFVLAILLSPIDIESAYNAWVSLGELLYQGVKFSVPLMCILTCHEFGHYIQTRRYGVYSSLPYFIPMPIGPFGTMGAVIAMDGRIPHSRALFDIGISGPLAGLVPTMFCLYYGIKWSHFGPVLDSELIFGEPLLFQYFTYWIFGAVPSAMTLYVHPIGMAGWVGLFLTSLNLMPFGQLDGGHVFYALLGRRAAIISWTAFYVVIILVVLFQLWHWSLILILLAWIGVTHPPTANDAMPLTPFRRILGWGTLAFIVLGFTPTPIILEEPEISSEPPKLYCYVTESEYPFYVDKRNFFQNWNWMS